MKAAKWLGLLLIVVGIHIHGCLCEDDDEYQKCRQLFECGADFKIGYPFWGAQRPASCGLPPFHLTCRNNIPLLNISSITYRLLAIDPSNKTLTVSRDDLWDDTVCQTLLLNTTLNSNFFRFHSTVHLINLFYNCNPTPNRSNCTTIGDFFQLPPPNATNCTSQISVAVNQTTRADALTASTLQTVLRDGFWIHWSSDDQNCQRCEESGGVCGTATATGSQPTTSFACYCANNGTSNSTCSNHSAPGKGHLKSHWPMYVIIGVALVAAALIFYATRNCRLHILMDQPNASNTDEFLLNSCGALVPKRYSYGDIKKITKFFSHKLGQGGNGTVYQGNLPDGHLVAVKVLSSVNDKGEEFMNEVVSISTTSHVNIVNLLGFCYDGNTKALVYEFMPNGSLDKFLYKTTGAECQLPLDILYQIAVGVARGLEYLHRGCNTSIVHFDIKPHNILLDKDFCPKIADFGLAKLCKGKQCMVSILDTRGTIGYIAPEVFSRDFGPVSHKSDVYSYGMMLLEMAGARKFEEIEAAQSSENYFPDQIYKHVVINSNKPDVITEENTEFARKLLLVGLWCIQMAPSNRPSMTKVVEMLEGSLDSIQIPPKSVLYPSKLFVPQFVSTFSVDGYVNFQNSTDH